MMQNRKPFFLTAIPFFALVLSMTGCGNSTGGAPSVYSYSGWFTMSSSVTGLTGNVALEFDNTSAAKAVTSETYALTGRLKNADKTYQLRGVYEPGTGVFTVSSDGENLRYSIRGVFGTGGSVTSAEAVVWNKSKNDDKAMDLFKVNNPYSSSLSDEGQADLSNALPKEFWGRWILKVPGEGTSIMSVSPFTVNQLTIKNKDIWSIEYLIVEIMKTPGEKTYDFIYGYPSYPTGSSTYDNQIGEAFAAYVIKKLGISVSSVKWETGDSPSWPDNSPHYAVKNGELRTNGEKSLMDLDWFQFGLSYIRDTLNVDIPAGTVYGRAEIALNAAGELTTTKEYQIDGGRTYFDSVAEAKSDRVVSKPSKMPPLHR